MLSRRTMLAGAAMAAAMPERGHAQAAHAKGPLVWMDMDQKALDDAYDQAVYAPNIQIVLKRRLKVCDLVRQRLGEPKRFQYGKSQIEGLDVFPAKAPNASIMIFVHGGAWRNGRSRDYHFPAETFHYAGANFVVPDFNNVTDPEAGGSLMFMADQIRQSVVWTYRNAKSFGGDPERIYVCGHSSGGHWAGVLVTTDWKKLGVPADIIKGAAIGSGMFDLKAPRLSARSSYVKFTDEAEQELSAQRHLDRLVAPVALIHGDKETPEFQRQSRDFFAAVKAAGKPATLAVMEGYNHFEVMESLANPYSLFGIAALETMKLRPA